MMAASISAPSIVALRTPRARRAASAAAAPRCCLVGEQAPAASLGGQAPAHSRRVALGAAVLSAQLALLGRPAGARGLDTYIRTPKPPQPPELIAAAVLLAREELTQFEKVLKSSADFDATDLRALLRAGPFRKFRDALRKVGKSVPDPKAGGADAEACFNELQALDFVLIELAKGDAKGDDEGDDKDKDKAKAPAELRVDATALRADAAARIGAAIASLDAVLAQLPQETMSAARAALE